MSLASLMHIYKNCNNTSCKQAINTEAVSYFEAAGKKRLVPCHYYYFYYYFHYSEMDQEYSKYSYVG